MAWQNFITTMLYGRRFGLQQMSTTQTGTGQAGRVPEFLTGAEDIRKESTTADSTGTNLKAWGASLLSTGLVTATDSTSVFRLDPPIPGVEKTITWASTTVGTMATKIWVTVSTGGGAGLQTSGGSSFTCMSSSVGNVVRLMGLSTSLYAVVSAGTPTAFTTTT